MKKIKLICIECMQVGYEDEFVDGCPWCGCLQQEEYNS